MLGFPPLKEATGAHLEKQRADHDRFIDNLSHISPHQELFISTNCLHHQKVLFLLCSSQNYQCKYVLRLFDYVIRLDFCRLLNVDMQIEGYK